MEQYLEVQGFDFNIVPAEKRERARELDAQCGAAIQRLSYTVDEIAEICTEMQEILPHGTFEPWYESRGLTKRQVYYAINRMKKRAEDSLGMIDEKLQIVTFDAPEQASIPELTASTQEQDEKVAQRIAELQRAEQIARDEMRSALDRSTALDRQIAYYKQQLEQVKAAPPKTIEKKVEVTPQHVLDRQQQLIVRQKVLEERLRELATQKAQVQTQAEQFKKERDLYKRDLDKDRQADNARFLQNLETDGSVRIRTNFAEVMREIVAWSRTSGMKLPSVIDAQVFEGEEWQRLEEAIQACDALGQALRKMKNTASSSVQQSSFIIDSTVVEGITR